MRYIYTTTTTSSKTGHEISLEVDTPSKNPLVMCVCVSASCLFQRNSCLYIDVVVVVAIVVEASLPLSSSERAILVDIIKCIYIYTAHGAGICCITYYEDFQLKCDSTYITNLIAKTKCCMCVCHSFPNNNNNGSSTTRLYVLYMYLIYSIKECCCTCIYTEARCAFIYRLRNSYYYKLQNGVLGTSLVGDFWLFLAPYFFSPVAF